MQSTRCSGTLQFLMVRELYTLSDKAHRSRHQRNGGEVDDKRRAPRWFFFGVATFWMYSRCAGIEPGLAASRARVITLPGPGGRISMGDWGRAADKELKGGTPLLFCCV